MPDKEFPLHRSRWQKRRAGRRRPAPAVRRTPGRPRLSRASCPCPSAGACT
jgi:hypothetical protein